MPPSPRTSRWRSSTASEDGDGGRARVRRLLGDDGPGRGGGGPVRRDGRAEPEMKGPRAEIDQRTADQEGDRADEREGGVREGRPNAGAPGG